MRNLRRNGDQLCQLLPFTGDIHKKPWRLVNAWIDHLCGCAAGLVLHTWLINNETPMAFAPLQQQHARQLLTDIATAWLQALQAPLPLAPRTGFDCISGKAPNLKKAASTYEGGFQHTGERDYASNRLLRRSFPDFEALTASVEDDQPLLVHWARLLYLPLLENRQALDSGGEA